jgi:hypothetical protein
MPGWVIEGAYGVVSCICFMCGTAVLMPITLDLSYWCSNSLHIFNFIHKFTVVKSLGLFHTQEHYSNQVKWSSIASHLCSAITQLEYRLSWLVFLLGNANSSSLSVSLMFFFVYLFYFPTLLSPFLSPAMPLLLRSFSPLSFVLFIFV